MQRLRLLLVDYVNLDLFKGVWGRQFASLKGRVVNDTRMIWLVIIVIMRIVKLGVVVGVCRYGSLIIFLALVFLHGEGHLLSFLPLFRGLIGPQ